MQEPAVDLEIEQTGGPVAANLAIVSDVEVALSELAAAFAADAPMEMADVSARVERVCQGMHGLGLRGGLPVNHFFSGRMYARELLIPAGFFAIGEIPKERHISVISRGEISMLNADGGITRIRAPYTLVSEPGVRKCGFAHEDVVWTAVYDVGDSGLLGEASPPIEELEKFIVARTPEEYLLHRQSPQQIEA